MAASKDPYAIIKHQHVTEKSKMLQELKNVSSNPCVARCESPKYVFVVDTKANKQQIKEAVEQIYKEKNIRVKKVNTSHVRSKSRRVRGREGMTSAFKKAVVTLDVGDSIDQI
jgi:large subunit ribosomal protein L23